MIPLHAFGKLLKIAFAFPAEFLTRVKVADAGQYFFHLARIPVLQPLLQLFQFPKRGNLVEGIPVFFPYGLKVAVALALLPVVYGPAEMAVAYGLFRLF